ncbi:peroxidase-related enzyme [Variovorax paradoxus]|nr:peroxidase-related enzyme [Variovorax paradoxus]
MTTLSEPSPAVDVIDATVPLVPGHATRMLRQQRDKVVAATQGSYDAMFSPSVEGLSVAERLLVALHACSVSKAATLAAHYRERLLAEGADRELAAAVGSGAPVADARLRTVLAFTASLIERPIEGDRAAVRSLADAGLSTPAIVALGQLIAFLSYQVRVVAGLQALAAAEAGHERRAGPLQASSLPLVEKARSVTGAPMNAPIRIKGFTNEVLSWKPWLDPVDVATATPAQLAALDEMSPQARSSPYFLVLAHQPEMLLQRSIAFNAIMFAPNGMPRAERELGATVESRVNGCVYCASVHAQRFEQLAKRSDVISQVFEEPASAGTTLREKAIVLFSIRLGAEPGKVSAEDVRTLEDVGLTGLEILDLAHSVALFAWANRLMLNLGEPVFPAAAAAAAS